MICDFCSSPEVVWVYPARRFQQAIAPTLNFNSDEDWVACQVCYGLIERTERDALTTRSATLFGVTDAEGVATLRGLHDRFWENRDGRARRLDADEPRQNTT